METKISLKRSSTMNAGGAHQYNAIRNRRTAVVRQAAPTKWCKRCKMVKPVANFGNHARTVDKLQPLCRDCMGTVIHLAHVERKAKICVKCNAKKPYEAFSKNNKATDGLQSYCKACMKVYKQGTQTEKLSSKTCRRCEKTKPTASFHGCSSTRDGLHSWCKTCVQEYDRQRTLNRQTDGATACVQKKESTIAPEKPSTKICSRCKKEKDKALFNNCSSARDGLHSWCKTCMQEYDRQRALNRQTQPSKRNKITAEIGQPTIKQEQAIFKLFDKIAEKYLNDKIDRFVQAFAEIGKEIFEKTVLQQFLRNE